MTDLTQRIQAVIAERFGAGIEVDPSIPNLEDLARSLEHRAHRKWSPRPVAPGLLELLFASALSAPSKSDLQQADIVHVVERAKVARSATWPMSACCDRK